MSNKRAMDTKQRVNSLTFDFLHQYAWFRVLPAVERLRLGDKLAADVNTILNGFAAREGSFWNPPYQAHGEGEQV